MAVGGDWRGFVVGHWWLVGVGGWQLVAVGSGWQLVVGGGWRLAVGGPWVLSFRAVLSKEKPSSFFGTALPCRHGSCTVHYAPRIPKHDPARSGSTCSSHSSSAISEMRLYVSPIFAISMFIRTSVTMSK